MNSQIGPYRIESELGRGGMGVVYRAHDERLGRTVAIKALPAELADDPSRLERFEREARTLAQLNHPNLAGIHGLEEHDGSTYLVLEFVEGETLADRLNRGVLEGDEAVELATQIAAGVEAAHEAGVVHRDLKPGNIMLTPEGKAKVLDFGLARTDMGTSSTGSGLSQSPTMTTPEQGGGMKNSPTIPGAILGTAAYMSPEQARGRRVDKRTDIWSFGVVLYEMLAGASPFVGETAGDSIGAVLHKDIDLSRLPNTTPHHLRRVLHRCLERDKDRRYRDIGDVRIELFLTDSDSQPVAARRSSPVPWIVAAIALALGAVGVALGLQGASTPSTTRTLEVDIRPPDGGTWIVGGSIGWGIISPDGTMVVGLATTPEGTGLWIKPLDGSEPRLIAETADALYPFWSPDSREIAYNQNNTLYKVGVDGGRPRRLCDSRNLRGGDWHPNGQIIFTPEPNGDIYIVSDQGGEPIQITKNDPARGENAHYWPKWLPDGERFIYFIRSTDRENQGIFFGAVPTSGALDEDRRLILPADTNGHFVPASPEGSAALLWVQDGDLLAREFDPATGSVLGPTSTIDTGVAIFESQLASLVGVTDGGDLLWANSGFDQRQLTWHGRTLGESVPAEAPVGMLANPRVSPDGKRVSFMLIDGGIGDIWVHDIEANRSRPALISPTFSMEGVWSPDSTELLSNDGGLTIDHFVRYRADGVGTPSRPFRDAPWAQEFSGSPLRWVSDQWLIFTGNLRNENFAIYAANLDTPEAPPVLLENAGLLYSQASVSPSNDAIIYVRRSPDGIDCFLASFSISDDGPAIGDDSQLVPIDSVLHASWSHAGDEFFVSTRTGDLWSVEVSRPEEHGGRVRLGQATRLRNIPSLVSTPRGVFAHDVSNDRFMVATIPNAQTQTFTLLTNWRQRMKAQP